MLFIGLCIAIAVISIIIMATTKSDFLYEISEKAIVATIPVALILLALIIFHKVPFNSSRAKAELQAKHDAIVAVLKKNETNYISFSNDVGAYNAAVLKGRCTMDNVWFKDFDYDFYYDLKLVEIE